MKRLFAALMLLPVLASAHSNHPCPVTRFGLNGDYPLLSEGLTIQLNINDALTQDYIDGDVTLQFSFDQAVEMSMDHEWAFAFRRQSLEYESQYITPDQFVMEPTFWQMCDPDVTSQTVSIIGGTCTSGTSVDMKWNTTVTVRTPTCDLVQLQNQDEYMGGASAPNERQWGKTDQYIWEIQPDLEVWPGPNLDDFCTPIFSGCSETTSWTFYTVRSYPGPHGAAVNMIHKWGNELTCDENFPEVGPYPGVVEIRVNWWSDTTSYDGGECYHFGPVQSVNCKPDPCDCCQLSEQKASRRTTFGEVKAIYREDD